MFTRFGGTDAISAKAPNFAAMPTVAMPCKKSRREAAEVVSFISGSRSGSVFTSGRMLHRKSIDSRTDSGARFLRLGSRLSYMQSPCAEFAAGSTVAAIREDRVCARFCSHPDKTRRTSMKGLFPRLLLALLLVICPVMSFGQAVFGGI